MFSVFSYLKNIFISQEEEICEKELWDEIHEKSDEFLEKLRIEQLCDGVPETGADLGDSDVEKEEEVHYSDVKEGIITKVKKDGGVINNVYLCRSEDVLPHIIQVGDHVQFRSVLRTEDNEEGLFVKVEKIFTKDSNKTVDIMSPSKLIGQSFDLERNVTGKITNKCKYSLTVDNRITLDLNVVMCDLVLEIGDKVVVECTADITSGNIKNYKCVKPACMKMFRSCIVTHFSDSMGIGIVKYESKSGITEIAFSKSVSQRGYLPALNDLVSVDAIESDQELFTWRAINMKLEKRAEINITPTSTKEATHEGLWAKCVSENRFDMDSCRPAEFIFIELRNNGTCPRTLLGVTVDNQGRGSGHLISQLRTLRPSHERYVRFPATISARNCLQFVMEVVPRFLGKSSENVTFSLDSNAELKVPVELEIYIEGLQDKAGGKGGRRFAQKKNLYTADDICFRDSLFMVIKGIRPPSAGMKFISVRTPSYDVPQRLLVACRGTRDQPVTSESQMVSNLKAYYGDLFQPLSEDNYVSKFHTCLFLEEISLLAHMANLDISKGVLRHAGEFLALYVVGLLESRPSVIVGDRVYASVPDDVNTKDKATYEGFIHSIRAEELYIKFSPSFHASYRGESYRFRFVHSRAQFRRLHHVLDQVLKPRLGAAWLFPRTLQCRTPVLEILGEDQVSTPPEHLTQRPELLSEKLRRMIPDPARTGKHQDVPTDPVEVRQDMKGELENRNPNSDQLNDVNDSSHTQDNLQDSGDAHLPPTFTTKSDTINSNDENQLEQIDSKILTSKEAQFLEKLLNPNRNDSRQIVRSPPRPDGNQTNSGYRKPSIKVNDLVDNVNGKSTSNEMESNGKCKLETGKNMESTGIGIETLKSTHQKGLAATALQDRTNGSPVKTIGSLVIAKGSPSKSSDKSLPLENWGKTKHDTKIAWETDFSGMGGSPSKTPAANRSLTCIPFRQKKIRWFNRSLNWYQKAAVRNILKFEARPLPYVIFGPPGTGKTITVTETVLQVYHLMPESRIILATPNNASADLLTENLIASGQFRIGDLVRLLGFTYLQTGAVPTTIAPYCSLLDNKHLDDFSEPIENKGGVTLESRESLLQHRLIISTCSSFGHLIAIGTPPGYFTHCIVDEAGQATEPEVLIPISFLHKDNGHVVLAGDPLQLGPTVLSNLGQKLELATSLLERLTGRFLYSRDVTRFHDTGGYDPRLVTRLVDNYRTLPEILKISSDLFYDSSLIPHVSIDDYEGLVLRKLAPVLPPRAQPPYPPPIIFHGVQGENAQDRDSPSWYNATEAVVVVSYLRKLYVAGLQPDQIGIITPYRKQVTKIRSIINGCGIPEPKVASIEEFQGQERLVIIVSTVRSQSASSLLPQDRVLCLGFIGLPTRLNVAMTRARALLIIAGDPNFLAEDVHWARIIGYVQSVGGYTGCVPSNPKLLQ